MTAINQVDLDPISGRGDEILDQLFVSTDTGQVVSSLPAKFASMIGTIEYKHLCNSAAILHFSEPAPQDIGDGIAYLDKKMALVQLFLQCLWLVKDNAADHELCFVACGPTTATNYVNSKFSLADGSHDAVRYSRAEVRTAREYARAITGGDPGNVVVGGEKYFAVAGRVSRAFYWVSGARGASHNADRIAMYCTALEALFATSTSELAHQLAERAAVLLGSNSAERHRIYSSIKTAYGYRSKILHGAAIKKSKLSELVDAVRACDELLRRSLVLAITSPDVASILNSKNDAIDEYFRTLLFDDRRSARGEVANRVAGGLSPSAGTPDVQDNAEK